MITFVFRESRARAQSIEKLFGYLIPEIEKHWKVRVVTLPSRPGSFLGLVRNFLVVLFSTKGVVHITGDCHYVSWMIPWRKTVLTVHDLNFLGRLKGFKKLFFELLWFRLPAHSASAITVISPETGRQLNELFQRPRKGIRVVPNCVTAPLIRTTASSSQPARDDSVFWILQVGSGIHKNLGNLIEAVEGSSFGIWVVGSPPEQLRNRTKDLGIPVRFEVRVSEERLAEIYSAVNALFFCSYSEGFGLPILEAQTYGVPVITSKISSMPWVAGKGALLVDPYSVSEIRTALDRLRVDKVLQQKLVKDGYRNLERFSVEKIANEYMNIYGSLSG